MSGLETLILDDNYISALPTVIYRLKSLRVLSARNNALEYLPAEVNWMRRLQLQQLKLTGRLTCFFVA